MNIERFFNDDINIKKVISSLTPPNLIYANDNSSVFEYSTKLLNGLDEIKYYMTNMSLNMEMKNYNSIIQKIKNIQNQIINAGSNLNRLKDIYRIYFYDMNDELLKKVNENYFGYRIEKENLFPYTTSINEMLHVLHTDLVNDENLYKKFNLIKEDKNKKLCGQNTILANNIFENINIEKSDKVHILSVNNNKVLIMARDIGHALTIEITKENEQLFVNYFIPKICNIDKVNNLPGVNKITNEDKFAKGMFIADINNIGYILNDFMNKVPTDDDIVYERSTKRVL